MSGLYSVYPSASGGGGGTLSSVSFSIGQLDGQAATPNGGSVSSNSIFLQGATATFPGLVSSAAQTFAGVKTFNSGPVFGTAPTFSSLTPNLPIQTDGSSVAISLAIALNSLTQTSGSISLTTQVVNQLPITQTSGSVSLTNKVVGNLPLSQTQGSLSLTLQVVGMLPIANGGSTGSNSGDLSIVTFGGSPNANGGSITNQNLTLQPANGTNPGGVTAIAQTFGGIKTLLSPLVLTASGSASSSDGTFFYDNTVNGLTFQNSITSVSLQIGQEQWVRVYNNSSASILNGRAVYVTGASSLALGGDTPTIGLALATTQSTSQFVGVTTHDIGNGQFGFVTQQGKVHGLDTTGFGSGQRLWLSTASAGFFQNADPAPPFYSVFGGYVLDIGSTTGSLFLSGIRSGTQKPFVNPMTSPGDMIIGSGSGVAARFAGNTSNSLSFLAQTGSASVALPPIWRPVRGPSIQTFTTGSGSYTTPTTAIWLKVRMTGGGGGGQGGGTTPGAPGEGTNTSFGTSFLVCSSGGSGGVVGGGALGGDINIVGHRGNAGIVSGATNSQGGSGGFNPLGLGGSTTGLNAGGNAATGYGGGGAGGGATIATAGTGGGAGGYLEKIIIGPLASYAYTVGSGGGAGSAGTSGQAGGPGTSGIIIVEEYYQ